MGIVIEVDDILPSKSCGNFRVLRDEGYLKVTIQFINTGYTLVVRRSEIRSGYIKDPYHPSIFGVAYVGTGKYTPSCGKTQCEAYRCWFSMLTRCYGKIPLYTSYSDRRITVCDEWLNYQVFAEWYYEHKVENWELDKDFLGSIKKIPFYCPEVCEFLPKKLNSAIVRLFKTGAELPLGVSNSDSGKYIVRTRVEGREVYLGTFGDKYKAFNIYQKHKRQYLETLVTKYEKELSSRFKSNFKDFKIQDPSIWKAHEHS